MGDIEGHHLQEIRRCVALLVCKELCDVCPPCFAHDHDLASVRGGPLWSIFLHIVLQQIKGKIIGGDWLIERHALRMYSSPHLQTHQERSAGLSARNPPNPH